MNMKLWGKSMALFQEMIKVNMKGQNSFKHGGVIPDSKDELVTINWNEARLSKEQIKKLMEVMNNEHSN